MNSKSVNVILCFFLITALFSITGCTNSRETIKIGVIGTMSGINSDLSVSGRRGVELAVDEINKANGINGRKVELVVKDDKNDSSTAEKAYREFAAEKIPVVIGPYTSGMIVNSIDSIRNMDILVLGPTISADSLSEKDDNFIRFIASTKEQAVVLADMAKKNNDKKFAVIYDIENKGFNEALYNNFKSLLESNNGEVVMTLTFSSREQTDFLALAQEVKKACPDGIFIIANSANNAELNQQIRKIHCEVQVYSPLWSNTDDLYKKGGTAIEGMYIVGGIDINDKGTDFSNFKEKFVRKYGEDPTFSSVYSYETAKALFQALKKGGNLKPSTIKENIINIKDFKGLQGDFQIDRFGDNTRRYMIFKIENGQPGKVD